MRAILKRLVARSPSLSAAFGDVIFETTREDGICKGHSFLQWRVKKSLDEQVYISAKMVPDAYEGNDRIRTYINFDIKAAERLRDHLIACIEIARTRSS